MEGPVGTFARSVRPSRDLDEAVVEAAVVSQGVLPALSVLPVVGEVVHDELVDVGERQHPLGGVVDGHGREGDVGVGRLGVAVTVAAWSGHAGAESHWCLHNSGANKQLENGRLAAAQLSCRGGAQVRRGGPRTIGRHGISRRQGGWRGPGGYGHSSDCNSLLFLPPAGSNMQQKPELFVVSDMRLYIHNIDMDTRPGHTTNIIKY